MKTIAIIFVLLSVSGYPQKVTPSNSPQTVTYGGRDYHTVQIGTQVWMKENLDVGTMINGNLEQTNNSPVNVIEKYCYNNNPANCAIYGGLYQWGEMVQYLNGASNTENWNPVPTGNVQGICPTGWHIPTNNEWEVLMNFLGGVNMAGGKLKEAGTSHYKYPNVLATNASGFTSIPGGQRDGEPGYYYGQFFFINSDADFWTITSGSAPTDIYYGGTTYIQAKAFNGQFHKGTGVSIRCIKN